jgi:hypothetical protein
MVRVAFAAANAEFQGQVLAAASTSATAWMC